MVVFSSFSTVSANVVLYEKLRFCERGISIGNSKFAKDQQVLVLLNIAIFNKRCLQLAILTKY
jgi:hypothetical protein